MIALGAASHRQIASRSIIGSFQALDSTSQGGPCLRSHHRPRRLEGRSPIALGFSRPPASGLALLTGSPGCTRVSSSPSASRLQEERVSSGPWLKSWILPQERAKLEPVSPQARLRRRSGQCGHPLDFGSSLGLYPRRGPSLSRSPPAACGFPHRPRRLIGM